MTLASLKSYSSFLKGATINISPNVYRGLDLMKVCKYPFISILWCHHLLAFPFLSFIFPSSNLWGTGKLLGKEYSGLHWLKNWAVWLQVKWLPGKCQFPIALYLQSCRASVLGTAHLGMLLGRPLCTETFMENDWALSPHQMWWEISPRSQDVAGEGTRRELGLRAR